MIDRPRPAAPAAWPAAPALPAALARGPILLLTLGLVLPGCASPHAAPAPPAAEPARALDDAAITTLARLLQLEDRRAYDARAFQELLQDDAAPVRSRVATAAGRIGDPGAIPLLVRILESDPAVDVRADAAFALGLIGDTSAAVVTALETAAPSGWVPAADAGVPLVAEVLAALGRLGDDRSRALVHAALLESRSGDSPRHRQVAGEALLAVWKFGDGAGNVAAALPYLDDPDPELRWRAAYALMRGGHPSALRPLLARHDDDARVRGYTARALSASAADSAGVAAPALERLTALLGDPHPHVRVNAVRALAGSGDRAAPGPMAALLHDPVHPVGMAAAGALAQLGPRARAPLADALDHESLPLPLRGAILQALAPLAPELAAERAGEWAAGDARHRYFAARSLAGLDPDAARELADRLAADADRRVALAALVSAAARGESAADSARLLAAADRLGATGAADAGGPAAPAGGEVAASPAPTSSDERELSFYEEIVRIWVAAPLAGEPRPRVRIETPHGPITLELLAEDAPLTVHNFVSLARGGFFDHGVWHRVIPDFVLQDGAPGGYPDGGPGWAIRDELNRHRYRRGTLGMALSGPDTGGSQWFITHSPQPHLDGGYTVFGRVIDGMAAADAVLQGEFIPSVRVLP